MRVKEGRWLRWALLVAPAIVAALVSLWGTAHGPATNEDSYAYICGAQKILEKGAFLVCGSDRPQLWFPPFYSFLLAILDALGLRRMEGARALCAICFAASTLLTGRLLYTSTSSLVPAIIGELIFLTLDDVVSVHLYAMSEAPFVVLLLLFTTWILRALDDDRTRWLILAGLAGAAASLTRYMGASLIGAGAIAIVWYDARPISFRLRRGATFLNAGGVPLAAWMCRNLHVAGSLTSRHRGYYPLDPLQYSKAAYTVVRWFCPFSLDTCKVLGAPVMVGVLLAFVLVLYWNPGKLAWLMALVALSNLAFIVGSRLFLDPYVVFAGRMLVPILVCLLIMILRVAYSILTRPTVNPRWQAVAVSIAVLMVLANGLRAREKLNIARHGGYELSQRFFTDSALIAWLARLPSNTLIYSDEPEPIYFFSGRIAQLLPMITNPNGKKPRASFAGEVSLMHDRLDDHPGVIVYFDRAHEYRRDNMATPVLMPFIYRLSLRMLFHNQDGAIYEMRAAPPPSSRRDARAIAR
jgi:Dolichyl-phosphate-mannose-protein mannosyltransferase